MKHSAATEAIGAGNTWHPSETWIHRDDRLSHGKKLREKTPRSDYAIWSPRSDRPDPVALVERSNAGCMPELIPVRHARMMESPFAFYRGTALNMAADLAHTPTSGIDVQVCGDCHLLNFGAFATPERRMIFDINDLDETLKAPWEWDVKRLAASFVLAGRHNGFDEQVSMEAAYRCMESYRIRTLQYSEKTVLETRYDRIDVEELLPTIHDEETKQRAEKRLEKAREHSVMADEFPELTTVKDGFVRIKDNPPLIFHWADEVHHAHWKNILHSFEMYRETLQEDRRELLDRFQLMDIAFKVVGVGSVGTLRGIMLLMASDTDPLFLQIKQARIGPRIVCLERSPCEPRPKNCAWIPHDASCQRYLLGMDRRCKRAVLCPSTEGYEDQTCGRVVYTKGDDAIRRVVRMDIGTCPRPFWKSRRSFWLYRQER